MRIIEFIKGLIMKACRFIFNTDYATSQNDAEIELSVTLPSSFTVPATQVKEFKATKDLPGSASQNYRCIFTSTAYNYAVVGGFGCYVAFGNDNLRAMVQRDKDKFILNVFTDKLNSSHTYSGTSQVITVRIQTFIDPFQA